MKILITGATGFVGSRLTNKLLSQGHEINVLSRDALKVKKIFQNEKVKAFEWRNSLELPPLESISGIDGVINLMGENIGAKKWSSEQKIKLRQSRVDATKNLVKLIDQNLNTPLSFFISSSAVGVYPANQKNQLNEESPVGHTYLAELCSAWEEAALSLVKTKRKVIIRTGVVLEKSDGALKKMLPPFQLGLGGPIGDGNQMLSWIHLDDLVNLYLLAATDESIEGIYNGCAPSPVCNFDFTKALGHALRRPTLFPVPTLPLKLAFGEMSSIILDSQNIISKRLSSTTYKFQYPTIDKALNAIFGRQN